MQVRSGTSVGSPVTQLPTITTSTDHRGSVSLRSRDWSSAHRDHAAVSARRKKPLRRWSCLAGTTFPFICLIKPTATQSLPHWCTEKANPNHTHRHGSNVHASNRCGVPMGVQCRARILLLLCGTVQAGLSGKSRTRIVTVVVVAAATTTMRPIVRIGRSNSGSGSGGSNVNLHTPPHPSTTDMAHRNHQR